VLLKHVKIGLELKGGYKMSINDMEKMKKFIEEKKTKGGYLQAEKKIGSGKVEKKHKNIGLEFTRSDKISQ